jgi:hypothetical protein
MHPISMLRSSAPRSCIWSASTGMALNRRTSILSFSTQTDSPTSKINSIQERFLVIPHKDLHPDLKLPAVHIKFQSIGRLGGALFYPLISVLGLPFMVFYTPVCVGTHHTSIRFAYRAALETFKAGDIVVNSDLNHEISSKLASKDLSRFHINYKGDLILHMHNSEFFSLSKFKGISLVEDQQDNLLLCKVNAIRDKIFPKLKSQISYFHLEEDIQKQAEKILTARQLRFRACMGTVLAASTLGASLNLLRNISMAIVPVYSFMGLITQGDSLSSFRVAKHTNDLWNLICQKNEFIDIIKPKYREFYQECDFNKDIYINISTFGNIQYSDQNSLSFRQNYLLKYTPSSSKGPKVD